MKAFRLCTVFATTDWTKKNFIWRFTCTVMYFFSLFTFLFFALVMFAKRTHPLLSQRQIEQKNHSKWKNFFSWPSVHVCLIWRLSPSYHRFLIHIVTWLQSSVKIVYYDNFFQSFMSSSLFFRFLVFTRSFLILVSEDEPYWEGENLAFFGRKEPYLKGYCRNGQTILVDPTIQCTICKMLELDQYEKAFVSYNNPSDLDTEEKSRISTIRAESRW